ncbi:hypothetical protein FRC06_004775, partial [Ceratobasidium sp. 370]
MSQQVQAQVNLAQHRHQVMSKGLGEVKIIAAIGGFQTLAHAALVRQNHWEQQKQLEFCEPGIVGLQAMAQGAHVRNLFWAWPDYLHSSPCPSAGLGFLMSSQPTSLVHIKEIKPQPSQHALTYGVLVTSQIPKGALVPKYHCALSDVHTYMSNKPDQYTLLGIGT